MEIKIERLMTAVRRTPLFLQLIPQEAGIGWPIPNLKSNIMYVDLPIFGYASTNEKGKTTLFSPFASITVNWSNGAIMQYINFRFRSPNTILPWGVPIGTFPHPAIANLTKSQYLDMRHDLLNMYDEMFDSLSQKSTRTESWEKQFTQLLDTLIEPSLKPYYSAMAPKFFNHFLPTMDSESRN